jgi:Heterokaryon incompatibility protein (HET)
MAMVKKHLGDSASLKATEPPPAYDNFYSPENRIFYAQSPYNTLDASQRHIRLLKFLPSDVNGLMSFALINNIPLASVKPGYTALSYCAGDPRKTETLCVNGIEFNAFANLGHALKEVKGYWEKNGRNVTQELLWVDQICIDQSKPEERSHQVGMMRDIYAGAKGVLITLSTIDTDPSGADGLEWVKQVRGHLQQIGCKGMEEDENAACHSLLFDYWAREFVEPRFAEGFLGFYFLLRSPWWTRAWIWQEFIVAREADFLFEGSSINWKDFAVVASHFRGVHSRTYPPFRACRVALDQKDGNSHSSSAAVDMLEGLHVAGKHQRYLAVLLFLRKYDWGDSRDLKPWLECGRHCQTSDPRDKIFAFLGLAYRSYDITTDYSVSKTTDNELSGLLIQVARKISVAEEALDLLSFAGLAWERYDYLPSWVPNWFDRQINFRQVLDTSSQGTPTCHFQPETSHPPWPPTNSLILHDGSTLRVDGFKLDTLAGEVFFNFLPRLTPFHTTKGFVVDFVRGAKELPGPRAGVKFRENDTLWWFPGTALVFVLRREKYYWLLLITGRLSLPEDYTVSQTEGAHYGWATNITKLILANDVAGLLTTPGFEREMIEIH